MKSAVETLNPTRVKMTVEVPYEELKPSIDAAYKTIGSQLQVPGFRKGKVPSRIIDQRVGRGAVLEEAVNEALPKFYTDAIEANEVRPLGQPEITDLKVPMADGEDFSFTAELDVRPEITLPDLDGIAIEVAAAKASDEDITTRLDALRARFGSLNTVEREVKDGDFVSLDLSASIDGDEVDSVSGVSYEVGSKNMLEGIDEALVGMSAGDTKEFKAPLAGGEQAGKEADCVVTVQSVKERELPALDDDFAQLASEFDTVEELRADVAKQAEAAVIYEQGIEARDKLMEHLLDTIEVEVPEGVVKAEVDSHLEGEGKPLDDPHGEEVAESTRKALRSQFLLDAIAEKNEVQVSQEELIEFLVISAQQYGMDPNQFAQMLDQQGQIPGMVGEVARRKALATVLATAKVTDTDGNPVDLNVEIDDEAAPAEDAAAVVDADAEVEAADGEAADADEAKDA